MHSTLNPEQADPHDVIIVAPDVVPVAHANEDNEEKAHDAMSRRSDRKIQGSDLSAGPSIPPVDTFRAAAVSGVQVPGGRPSMGGRAIRAFIGLLLAVGIGVPAIAWQSYGETAKHMMAKWAPRFVATSSRPETLNPSEQPGPPAVQASAANSTALPPAGTAQTVTEGVAPSPESAQLLQSMASDLATARQEIEQLKGSIEQLRANQEQMARDVARTPEQNARVRISALPSRPVVAPAPKPMRPFRPATAAALTLPQYAARSAPRQPELQPRPPQAAATLASPQYAPPSMPRQPEPQPQATAQPEVEPEQSSIPRPPMPIR
jgi:hypothetical protein